MTGFSADWLDLREAADHRARDATLAQRLASLYGERESVAVVDIGCGTGSNLRGLWRHLPRRQNWTLVDYDPALLAGARERLAAWADTAREDGETLVLGMDDAEIRVAFRQADLDRDLESALGETPDLVTAAAFFDLAGADFIERLAAAVVARGAAFYTVLTYDGIETWEPAHPADGAWTDAFLAHQREDKGLGLATGPGATRHLAAAFAARGWRTHVADSPWTLEAPADAALMRALAQGQAQAVRETGRLAAETVEACLAQRLAARTATIGHKDLLATP